MHGDVESGAALGKRGALGLGMYLHVGVHWDMGVDWDLGTQWDIRDGEGGHWDVGLQWGGGGAGPWGHTVPCWPWQTRPWGPLKPSCPHPPSSSRSVTTWMGGAAQC